MNRSARRHNATKPKSRSLGSVLARAITVHQAGNLDAAEPLYEQVLDMQTAPPDALHFLGVLLHQRGRSDEAVRSIRTSLQISSRHPDAHNNLGNIHKECGRLDEAEAGYRRALACNPRFYSALSKLALVLEVRDRLPEALEALTQWLKLAPDDAAGHYRLGTFLRGHAEHQEHVEQAAESFREAARLDRDNVDALDCLGSVLYTLGRREESVALYREWLQRDPDNPVPRHMLASRGAAEAPLRCADDYVRDVFDGFADSFDEQLLGNLGYRAPEVLIGALLKKLPAAHVSLDVLDAGCGTGLCAPLIRADARRFVGVDRSSGMVDHARVRGGYDALEVAELTDCLQRHPNQFDVVISADTLIYFGELTPVFSASHAALRTDGWLAFTSELIEGDEDLTELSHCGRYRHSRAYLERVLAQRG